MHVVVSKKLILPECLEILKCSRKCLKDTGSGLESYINYTILLAHLHDSMFAISTQETCLHRFLRFLKNIEDMFSEFYMDVDLCCVTRRKRDTVGISC